MSVNKKPCSPCKGCEIRHFNCHATCEGYNEFKKRQAEENERRHAAIDFIEFEIAHSKRFIEKNRQYHSKRR